MNKKCYFVYPNKKKSIHVQIIFCNHQTRNMWACQHSTVWCFCGIPNASYPIIYIHCSIDRWPWMTVVNIPTVRSNAFALTIIVTGWSRTGRALGKQHQSSTSSTSQLLYLWSASPSSMVSERCVARAGCTANVVSIGSLTIDRLTRTHCVLIWSWASRACTGVHTIWTGSFRALAHTLLGAVIRLQMIHSQQSPSAFLRPVGQGRHSLLSMWYTMVEAHT